MEASVLITSNSITILKEDNTTVTSIAEIKFLRHVMNEIAAICPVTKPYPNVELLKTARKYRDLIDK